MHDLVNDLAKSMSGEFFMEIQGTRVEGILERTRHIRRSLHLDRVDKLLEPIFKVTGLRSLILKGNRVTMISNSVQHDMFSRLKYLRMLSFSDCRLLELVDEISNLKLLRYLDLSHTEITTLPDTICMLYNLQTLLLQGCNLTELPSNFSKLINLRHLELPFTLKHPDFLVLPCIKKMPKYMEKLNNLQTLNCFIVEEQNGSNLKELAKLNHLHETIYIKGLGNVTNPADAVTPNLKGKKYLEELHMAFDGKREEMNVSIVERNVSVLEALQPNSNLKRLTIERYNGSSFPNWLTGGHLHNLASLELKKCGLCSHLPPLGKLSFLKELSISECHGIKTIGEEFYGNNSTNVPFRSLEVLRFTCMFGLEEWFCLEGFPLLKELYVKICPKLKRALPQHLPSLQKLEIFMCKELEASIPVADNIRCLNIRKCDSILVNELPTSLEQLVLSAYRYTEFTMDQILVNNTILEELELDLSVSVKFPSLDLCCYNSLRRLSIKGWRSSSFPFSLHLFTNLYMLKLSDSRELESFPMGGLPSQLSWLEISNCPKLIASREEWGLFQLNSLKDFFVSDEFENVESFPEENLLPPTLEFLYMEKCSKLRILNSKSLLPLKSLKHLWIDNCPCLEHLPEEGVPNSLSSLSITNCPLIKEQYQNEGGERWHTICHIPNVSIDYIQQQDQVVSATATYMDTLVSSTLII